MNWFNFIPDWLGSALRQAQYDTTITKRIDIILQEQNWYNDTSSENHAQKVEKEVAIKEAIRSPENGTNTEFCHPKPGKRITSPFGDRVLRINGSDVKRFHSGIDLAGDGPVYAVEDSIVQKVLLPDQKYPCRFKWTKENGWVQYAPKDRAWTPYIILVGKHTQTLYKYMHVNACSYEKGSLKAGQHVKAGEKIGEAGNLGYSLGAHLHFETWLLGKNGKYNTPDNPEMVLNKFGVT